MDNEEKIIDNEKKIMKMLESLRLIVATGTILILSLIVATTETNEYIVLAFLIITFVLGLSFFYQLLFDSKRKKPKNKVN